MTTSRPTPVRLYPRDVPVGTRVWVKMATGAGTRRVQGTLTALDKVGRGDYHVAVDLDGDLGRTHWRQAANCKLDTVRGRPARTPRPTS